MNNSYDGEYELPPQGLSNQNKGIHGNKKWALWSDWDPSAGEAKKVRLWIKSEKKLSGSDKLVVTPEGNIGIGIADPSAKLQISGDLVLEKMDFDPNPLSSGAARIFSDDKGVLRIQCPGDRSGNGTLQVNGNLSVDGNVSADKGLSVKNGLLEAKAGMTAEGALSAEAVKVSGGDLEAAKGLKVSNGLLEAKRGMTAEGALSAEAVKVSGGDLEAAKGLKVSKGLLEAKDGMTAEGLLTANCPVIVGGRLSESVAELVEANSLKVQGSLNADNGLIVRSNDNDIMSVDGNGVFVGQWIDGIDEISGKQKTPGRYHSDFHVNGNIKGSMPMSLSCVVDFTWWKQEGPFVIPDESPLELHPIPAFFWPNGRHRWVLWVHVGKDSEPMETEISISQSINDINIIEDIPCWRIFGKSKGWCSDINISNIGNIIENAAVDKILIKNKNPKVHVAIYAIGIIHEGAWDNQGRSVHIPPE